MARLIQKTGFISRKSAGGYMKYIATREGVEVLAGKGPPTEKQTEMVAKLLKDFPDIDVYKRQEQRLPARSFLEATDGCKEISREAFDALAKRRMENTGEVRGLFRCV